MTRTISRRLLLQGTGVALGLPLLDAMTHWTVANDGPAVPQRRQERNAPRRMVTICTTLGLHAPYLIPEQSGRDYQTTPYLEKLQAFRRELTVLSGLSHPGVD